MKPAYEPKNADPDIDTSLTLAGPGWALFNEETDDTGRRTGEIQADQETGTFTHDGVVYDGQAHWQVAYDYARMRAMLERVAANGLQGYSTKDGAALVEELRKLIGEVSL